MAKIMALLDGDTVMNTLWCSDDEPETNTLKEIGDYPVGIGDTYVGGHWYRDGVEILTPLESALMLNKSYEQALSEIEAALGVNG